MNRTGFFVDYYRTPKSLPKYIDEWVCIGSHSEFVEGISDFYRKNGEMPEIFSFDSFLHPEHIEFYFTNPKGTIPPLDLFEQPTGVHSCKFLGEVCKKNGIPMDFKVAIHSEDQLVGKMMQKTINSYKDILGHEQDCFLMDWKEYDYVPERLEIYQRLKEREYNEIEEQLRLESIAKRLEKDILNENRN